MSARLDQLKAEYEVEKKRKNRYGIRVLSIQITNMEADEARLAPAPSEEEAPPKKSRKGNAKAKKAKKGRR